VSENTIRLTAAQALVRYLSVQWSERDGSRRRVVPAVFGIFGHGNVCGLGPALEEASGLAFHQPKNEQAMVHTAAARDDRPARSRPRRACGELGIGHPLSPLPAASGAVGSGHEWYTPFELLALGFLATTARADEITLSLPPELAAALADALDHLRRASTGDRAAAFEQLALGAATAELRGPRDTLRELVAVAIDEAGERVSHASSRLLHGDATAVAALRAAIGELGGLLDLLETVSP
jgi:3D-(3,5/4)-trihydroxycyclohexane-1,2-dione acylhydrolase (decyclizing)